jgi:tetratricopeptide (TPR) repeat protein
VLATHYVDAYLASPEGQEADSVAAQARISLRAAADRASALGSHEQSVAYLTRALEVTLGARETGELLERIGSEQILTGKFRDAEAVLRRAIDVSRSADDHAGVVRATIALGSSLNSRYDASAALEALEGVTSEAADLGDGVLLVRLNGQIARGRMFDEQYAEAIEWCDRALVEAERQGLLPEIAYVLATKGIAFASVGRLREGIGLLEASERLATAIGQTLIAIRAQVNLTATLPSVDPRAAFEVGRKGAESCRRLGLRHQLTILAGNSAEAAIPTGEFSWTLSTIDELLDVELDASSRGAMLGQAVAVHGLLGREYLAELRELEAIVAGGEAGQVPSLAVAGLWDAALRGDYPDVFERALGIAQISLGNAPPALSMAARFSVLAHSPARVREALDRLAALGTRGPTLDAQVQAARAGLAALEGRWPEAAAAFQEVIRWLADQRLDFDLALVWMSIVATAPEGEPLAVTAEREARILLERMPSPPFLAQLDRLVAERATAARPAPRTQTTTASVADA